MTTLNRYKALITAGGIGTRLLPFSKEIPKEMFPIITKDGGGDTYILTLAKALASEHSIAIAAPESSRVYQRLSPRLSCFAITAKPNWRTLAAFRRWVDEQRPDIVVRGIESETLKVPAGRHTLRLRTRTADQTADLSRTITGEFIGGHEQTLQISFDKHNTSMHLEWE